MFFKRPDYFPKQLFQRFLVQQVLFLIPVLLLAAVLVRVYLERQLEQATSQAEVVRAFDLGLLIMALLLPALIAAVSLWTGYQLVLPLGRILVRARALAKRDYSQGGAAESSGEWQEADDGEWSDLESAISRISEDMKSKEVNLSRGREEMEAIISAIQEAVVAIDISGNLLFFNSQFVLSFGDVGRRQGRLSDFFRSPDVLEAFRQTLLEGRPRSLSTQLRRKGESGYRYFSLSVAPLHLEKQNESYGAVGVFHDVSELKHLDQVRIDFVANVSHELRTPLTSIKGYSETLKSELAGNSTALRFAEAIERNADRLISLVQDLLNLSTLESGNDLTKAIVDLPLLSERVSQQLDESRKAKVHSWNFTYRANRMEADEKRLEQVLFNLLENAIKYVPNHGQVAVTWDTVNGGIELRVRDNGPGIPPEHHARIFERFYRLDSARTRELGGTGLGLAIVKHIVQRHGGTIRLEGGPGQGSTFVCLFPQ
jgi:two-component system, OmpR family, phosphate regulon sensor histidine kinase PhoR